ncbi:transposase, partial [Escherichia coli]|nr:transposase [Escherichia coli]
MRKARFTENQIVTVIKSVEAGRTVKDICRGAGIDWPPEFPDNQ